MILNPTKLLISAMTLATLVLPASGEATKPAKPKKPPSVATTTPVQTSYRGQDKFRAGPLYNGQEYLGDDPDPFIRSQIQRDLGMRYPANN